MEDLHEAGRDNETKAAGPASKDASETGDKTQQPYWDRDNRVPVPIPVDGSQYGILWNDRFTDSAYSSSQTAYRSPIPGAYTFDWSNTSTNTYSRARTSSNASFIEPWAFPSRSPTSTAFSSLEYPSKSPTTASSSIAYSWTANAYPVQSLPVSSGLDPMSEYGYYGPRTMAQRDEEEQAFLFPEQSSGLRSILGPYERYLDNYWRCFHPFFPVIHRATFDDHSTSPMLRAAMIAIGAQYSNDPGAKRKSRIITDRCSKLFDKRELVVMTEPERPCDNQALFLFEVLSQYRARRTARTLSARFESIYHKAENDFRAVTSAITKHVSVLDELADLTYDHWTRWIELASQMRLLHCCYILEYQQVALLARSPQTSMIQASGFDLPFPVHSSVWDATCPRDWAFAIKQYINTPTYMFEFSPEVLAEMKPGSFDIFQSTLFTASYYSLFNNTAPYLSSNSAPDVLVNANPLDSSLTTKHHLLIAKLNQVTPVRSLLAVTGDSWIFSEKVTSQAAFGNHKSALQSWVNGLWSSPANTQGQAAKEALKLATEILQNAIIAPPERLRLEFGGDMGLYFAALVIWAATDAADAHAKASNTRNEQSGKDIGTSYFTKTTKSIPARTSTGPNSMTPRTTHTSSMSLPTSNSIVRSDITMASLDFLAETEVNIALLGLVPQAPDSISRWQQGCISLMRWVKTRICEDEVESETTLNSTGLGEVLDGIVAVLEKLIKRCSDLWPPPLETPGNTSLFYGRESPIDSSYDSDLWTDDSMSSPGSSQSLDGLATSISIVASFLYDQFQAYRCSKILQCMQDQTDTDQEVNSSNVSTNAGYSSNVTGESAGSFANQNGLQQQSRKRPPGDDDNNNNDRPPGKRRKVTSICEEPDTRLLACPFAKKDPLRHRKCFKYVLQDIARLKQHLMRVHRIPVHCARCSKIFSTEDERDSHLRQLPECPIEPPRRWDGISESQKRQLGKRVSIKKTKEENWYFIFKTLFPDTTLPETPYIDDLHLSEDLLALRDFAAREAPDRITQFTNSELPPDLRPNREHVEAFTQAAMREVFDILLDRWKTNGLPSQQQESANGPTPIGQERSQDSASSSGDHLWFAGHSAAVASSVSTSPPRNVLQTPSSQHTTEPADSSWRDFSMDFASQVDAIAGVSAVMGPAWNDFEDLYDSRNFDVDAFLAGSEG
ncbi:hypothetical protein EJ04DRAFT_509259 [Polyplosphaeria fusca]|uniref:Xylanolytic transcriptional activator regulatory domain-containing protein n=1 Tax=Polyplosphaeria fusca TaxID=682080 RepID=A0A9P4R7V2_9PLEO|nr:hypothetical protein EJ04DRAFT_509259 [Polyplosphaeria fusca]